MVMSTRDGIISTIFIINHFIALTSIHCLDVESWYIAKYLSEKSCSMGDFHSWGPLVTCFHSSWFIPSRYKRLWYIYALMLRFFKCLWPVTRDVMKAPQMIIPLCSSKVFILFMHVVLLKDSTLLCMQEDTENFELYFSGKVP